MKKMLLSIIYSLGCILSIQAQTLYGTTSRGGQEGGGTINKFLPATNQLQVVKSFESSIFFSPIYTKFVEASNGKLYGVTPSAGSSGYGYGLIFSFDPATATYSTLKYFDYTDGGYPTGGLIEASDGKLYGMTSSGGSNNSGVI